MGNPEAGGPSPEELGEHTTAEQQRRFWEQALEPGADELAEREIVEQETREALGELYELLPSDRKLSEVYIEDKLDEAGFKELLPAWRKVLTRAIERRQLHQETKEEFLDAGLAVLAPRTSAEAMNRAATKSLRRWEEGQTGAG
jgi:hypothetical protein